MNEAADDLEEFEYKPKSQMFLQDQYQPEDRNGGLAPSTEFKYVPKLQS